GAGRHADQLGEAGGESHCASSTIRTTGAESATSHMSWKRRARRPGHRGVTRPDDAVERLEADHRIGQMHSECFLATNLARRSLFKHTRVTTVVSQPPRLSTSPEPARLSRSQVSCT